MRKGANAVGEQSVAIGEAAIAGAKDTTGVVNQQSVAIGSKAQAIGDQAVAVGGNTNAAGNSSIAIGGDDLDKVASKTPPPWNAKVADFNAAKTFNDTDAAQTYFNLTGDILVHYENNKAAGSVADPNGVDRYTPTRSGEGAIAVGVSSTAADLATAFGTRANAYGVTSLALGVGSQAGVKGATGGEGDGAIAIGAGTKALGTKSIAQGTKSISYTQGSIAIGDASVAGNETDTTKKDAIAIGTGAKATGNQSISIGYGNVVQADRSGAIGDPTTIIASATDSYSIGNNNTVNTADTFVMGNNVTTTVANSVYLGKNAQGASADGATTAGTTAYTSTTIGSTTYQTYAGGTPVGVVTVGKAGEERRIQNVAAGKLSATSTDAINGSQLYAVATELDEQGYFHVNTGTRISGVVTGGNAGTGDAATNKGRYDEAAGATGAKSLAAGFEAKAFGQNATAIGRGSSAGQAAVAIGSYSFADSTGSTTIGAGSSNAHTQAKSIGLNATAISTGARAKSARSTAIGDHAYTLGTFTDAKGTSDNIIGNVAIGMGSVSDRGAAVPSANVKGRIIGDKKARTQSVGDADALAYDPTTGTAAVSGTAIHDTNSTVGAVSVGGAPDIEGGKGLAWMRGGTTQILRQITNVAGGSQDTDAVNVAQLKAVTSLANRENYFHTNDSGTAFVTDPAAAGYDAAALAAAGYSADNQAVVDGIGAATGISATTAGASATASANHGIAVGTNATAGDVTNAKLENSIAIGRDSKSINQDSIAIGANTIANAQNTTVVGYGADGTAFRASAYGVDSQATGESSVAVGHNAEALAKYATAVGALSDATQEGATAIGIGAEALALDSTSLGRGAIATAAAKNGVAIGRSANVSAENATAVGFSADAKLADSVALGSGSVADRKAGLDGYNPVTGLVDTADAGIVATKSTLAAVSIGSAGNTRQIINVAAGTQDSDAVNVAQLKALRTGLIGYEANVGGFALKAQDGVEVTQSLGKSIEVVGGGTTVGTYTSNNVRTVVNGGKIEIQMAESPKFGNVTINDGGTGKITGVAAGEISATSTEAVNGSQLYGTGNSIATIIGGDQTKINPDGTVNFGDAAGKGVGDTGETNIHDAIKSINTTANAGFTIAGASATTATDAKIVPTDTLNIVGADANTDFTKSDAGKNIYTVVDADNTVRIGLANDLDVTSVKAQTINATTSVTIGDTAGDNTVLTSTADGLDVGGDKITNVGAGDINAASSDAVNGSQIHNIENQNAINVFGGNATVNADGSTSFTDVGGTGKDTIHDAISAINTKAGQRNTTSAGTNIEVVETKNANGTTNYEVKTKSDVAFDNVNINKGIVVSGGATVNMGDNVITNVSAGKNDTDAVNVSQLNAATKGWNIGNDPAQTAAPVGNVKSGERVDFVSGDTNNTVVTVTDDAANGTSKVEVKVADNPTFQGNVTAKGANTVVVNSTTGTVNGLTNKTFDANNYVSGQAATEDQLAAVSQTVGANNEAINNNTRNIRNNAKKIARGLNVAGNSGKFNRQLGDTVTIKGGLAEEAPASNRNVRTTANGGVVEILISENPNFQGVEVEQSLKVNNGATVDMGGNRIQNVAAGTEPNDAVNFAQLSESYRYVDQVGEEASAGIAAAIAAANLPQPFDPGANMMSLGLGSHHGQQAIAIGVSTISDNGKWIIKGSLSHDTKKNVSGGVGVGFQW